MLLITLFSLTIKPWENLWIEVGVLEMIDILSEMVRDEEKLSTNLKKTLWKTLGEKITEAIIIQNPIREEI